MAYLNGYQIIDDNLCTQTTEHSSYHPLQSTAPPTAPPCKQVGAGAEPTTRRGTRNKKTKSKRAKQVESSDSTVSHHRQQHLRPPLLNHGLNPTSWSRSDTSQSTFPMLYPSVVPGYPLMSSVVPPPPGADATQQGFEVNQGTQAPPYPSAIPSAPYSAPLITPIMALVLPHYVYPPMAPGVPPPPPPQPVYHPEPDSFSLQTQPFCQAAFPGQVPFTGLQSFNSHSQYTPQAGQFASTLFCPPSTEAPQAPHEGQSRSSTPQSAGGGGPASPPLFHSRCSSPLNLLELELSVDRQDNIVLPSSGQGTNTTEREKGAVASQAMERELKQVNKDANRLLIPLLSFTSPSVRKQI